MKICRDEDLKSADFTRAIEEARQLWRRLCEEHVAKHGDYGTCVLGAGIAVEYKAPRARHATAKIVIAPQSPAQGASTWEASTAEVIAFLAARGIEAHYSPGFMD